MTTRISGVSKRHFRRLVQKEVQKMSSSKFADKPRPQSINYQESNKSNEEVQSCSHFASDSFVPENANDHRDNQDNTEAQIFENVNNPEANVDFGQMSDVKCNDLIDDLRDWCVRHRITRNASDSVFCKRPASMYHHPQKLC